MHTPAWQKPRVWDGTTLPILCSPQLSWWFPRTFKLLPVFYRHAGTVDYFLLNLAHLPHWCCGAIFGCTAPRFSPLTSQCAVQQYQWSSVFSLALSTQDRWTIPVLLSFQGCTVSLQKAKRLFRGKETGRCLPRWARFHESLNLSQMLPKLQLCLQILCWTLQIEGFRDSQAVWQTRKM